MMGFIIALPLEFAKTKNNKMKKLFLYCKYNLDEKTTFIHPNITITIYPIIT